MWSPEQVHILNKLGRGLKVDVITQPSIYGVIVYFFVITQPSIYGVIVYFLLFHESLNYSTGQ